MDAHVKSPGSVEKDRIRVEIDDQVRQFLQQGGRIDVLNDKAGKQAQVAGRWQTLDDELPASVHAEA